MTLIKKIEIFTVLVSGAVGPMFLGGPRAVLFRQTLTISDNIDNFPTGLKQ